MDATHLAEFHQVEGVVADRNLTLADLIGKLQWYLFFAFVRGHQRHLRIYASVFQKNGYD